VWAVQSAVELERLNIPTVAVATEAFAEMGQDTSRSLGMIGLPLAAVGHGFENLRVDRLGEVAELLYAEVVRGLTGSPADLEPDYAGRVWLPSDDAIAISCSFTPVA
jgi:hypothetical protein